MSDLVGQELGHFVVLAKIGAGGMGEVYRARDRRLEREVAIKVLPEEFVANAERLARFEREARAVAALDHPNILAIHELGDHGGRLFIVTELLEGNSLRHLISRRELTGRKVLEYAEQIADGLAAAHDRGIVHRDLKAENIFVTTDGRVKILDFGLARFSDRPTEVEAEDRTELLATRTGQVVGTLETMSPEQVRGQPVDARSDIFSLGVVMYEMFTGLRPFRRVTAADTASAILREDPPAPSHTTNRVLPLFDGIVRRCLDKRPEDRFQSARDVSFAIQAISAPPRARTRLPSPRSRNVSRILVLLPVVVAAALAFLLLATAYRAVMRSAEAPTPAAPPRLVVLPFANLGPEEQRYFAEGVTEEIMSRLAAVSGLRVISRTTAMTYAGTRKSVAEIGEELDVEYLLQGTVRWAPGVDGRSRVRVTPSLVRVDEDAEVWSKSYEHALDDIFAIQARVAEEVAEQLGVRLLPVERRLLDEPPTENIEAYQAYLRGRYLAARPHFSVATTRRKIAALERATELDPGFALAWAELAEAHGELRFFGVDLSRRRLAAARAAAERALALEPTSPGVRLALAYYYVRADRDAEAALSELGRAESYLPLDPEVLQARALIFQLQGRYEAALGALERAASLSPRDPSIPIDVGIDLWMLRRYREAISAMDRTIELAPESVWPYLGKALVYWSWHGTTEEAGSALESLPVVEHEWIPLMWYWQELYRDRPAAALEALDSAPGDWIWTKMWVMPIAMARAEVLDRMGRGERAREEWRTALAMLEGRLAETPDDPHLRSALGLTLAALGRAEEGVREVRRGMELLPLEKDALYGLALEWDLARVLVEAGDRSAAISQLERLLEIPSWVTVPWLEMDGTWDPLRREPAFQALLEEYRQR